MEWKHLKQSKGQTFQNFIEEFRRKNTIGSFHSYFHHTLLLFEPNSLDESGVKVVHLEKREKHEKDDHPKRVAITDRREASPFVLIVSNKGMIRRIAINCI